MKKVLILDAMIDRELNDATMFWSRYFRGVPFSSIHLPPGNSIPPLGDYSHLLITGSEASITDPQPWMDTAREVILDACDRGLPILGNCFGHQLIVWSLSDPQFTRRAQHPEIGWIEMDIVEEDSLLAGVPSSWHAFAFHFDEVFDLPHPWLVLASSECCHCHTIRFGEKPIWGIQAHPEMSPEDATEVMEAAVPFVTEHLPEHLPLLRKALQRPPRDDNTAQQIVDNFLRVTRLS